MYASLSRYALFKRFFSNAGWYGASIILTRAGWVLLLPLYWKVLTPSDFGVIGIAQLAHTLLIPVLSFGLADAVQRFFLDWPERERSRSLFTVVLVLAVGAGVICILLDFAGDALFSLLFRQVAFDPYFRIGIWTAFCGSLSLVPLAVLRVQERIAAYSTITVVAFLAQAGAGVYLVVFRETGPLGYLAAALIGAAVGALLSLIAIARNMEVGFSVRPLRASFAYGSPPAAALLIDSVSGVLDRFFLDKYAALSQIGLYTLANQFGSAFNVFNQALKTSWVPFLYRAMAERDDVPELLGRFAVIYLAVLAVPALAVALLAEDFIEIFGGERYRGVYPYVPFFVLYYYVTSTIAAMGRGMDLAKRTALWPLVPTAGMLVSIMALAWLVPLMGVWGAIVAMLMGGSTRAVVQVSLSVHYYPRPLYIRRLCGVVAITGAAFFMGHGLAPAGMAGSVAFKMAIILCSAPLVLWVGAGAPNWRSTLALVRLRRNGSGDAT